MTKEDKSDSLANKRKESYNGDRYIIKATDKADTSKKKKVDPNLTLPNQWIGPPNQMNIPNPNIPPMFIPGMMMPPQFPPLMMPFIPPEDEERMKAFQKAMMSLPFNTIPNKVLPNMMIPPGKVQPIKRKKKPKTDEFHDSHASDTSKRDLHLAIQKEIYNKFDQQLKEQDPYLYRLINIPGLFVNLSSNTKQSLIKLLNKLLDDKSLSSQQIKFIKRFMSNLKTEDRKKTSITAKIDINKIWNDFNNIMTS